VVLRKDTKDSIVWLRYTSQLERIVGNTGEYGIHVGSVPFRQIRTGQTLYQDWCTEDWYLQSSALAQPING
jgi:hypothetical protein